MKKLPFIIFVTLFILLCAPHFVSAAATAKVGTSTAGLVGWWSFDEGTSTLAHDFSGKNNTGTLTNSPVWVSGKRAKALSFNGTTQYVGGFGDIHDMLTNNQTISAWFKGSTLSQNGIIVSKSRYAAGAGRWSIYITTAGKVGAFINCGGSDIDTTVGATVVTDNKWHHIVGVWNRASVFSVYIDGVLDGTQNISSCNGVSMNNPYYFLIGTYGDETGTGGIKSILSLAGNLDDVRIYNQALNLADITALYRSGEVVRKQPDKSGLIGHWSFDEGTSTKATDFSGMGNTGTLTNSPTWVIGKKGKALSFNGSTQYIDLGNTSAFDFGSSNSFTLSTWVKTSTGGAYVRALSNGHNGFTNGWLLQPSSGFGTYGPATGIGAGGVTANSLFFQANSTINDGKWHLLTSTFNHSTKIARMYIDGVQVPITKYTGTCGTVTGNDLDFTACASLNANHVVNTNIGRYAGGNEYLNGSLDDVRIYNRALSTAEIAALYKSNQTTINASQANKVTNGLVGYWSLNGKDINWTTNTAYDTSGLKNNGTLTNLSMTISPVAGKVGQALLFNGTSQKISVPYSSSLAPTTVSFGGWFKTTDKTQNSRIISKTETGGYQLSLNENGICSTSTLCVSSYISGTYRVVTYSLSNIQNNVWYHAMGTYDGTNLKMYLNGVEVATGSYSGSIQYTYSNPLCIGTEPDATTCNAGSYFPGYLDEIRVYNRALSAAEILQLYRMSK